MAKKFGVTSVEIGKFCCTTNYLRAKTWSVKTLAAMVPSVVKINNIGIYRQNGSIRSL